MKVGELERGIKDIDCASTVTVLIKGVLRPVKKLITCTGRAGNTKVVLIPAASTFEIKEK